MTLTERRAVHRQLRKVAPNWYNHRTETNTNRRWEWYQLLRANLKDSLQDYEKHCEQFSPPDYHQCSLIGFQCPCKADQRADYTGDYLRHEIKKVVDDHGAKTLEEAQALAKGNAEKKRVDALKKH
jgi:hypothetical protein